MDTAKVSELITNADRLLTLSSEEVVQRKAQGAIDNWELVLHDSAFKLVNDLIDEDPNFLNLELNEQIKRLEDKAKSITPKALETSRDRLLNFGG
jgi:hypothetical protein